MDKQRDLEIQVKEKETELQRMKTTLVALTQKLNVANDQKDHWCRTDDLWKEADQRRSELQQSVLLITKTMEDDRTTWKTRQEKDNAQIDYLNSKIQCLL